MVVIDDAKTKELLYDKTLLIKKLEKNEITKSEYALRLAEIYKMLNDNIQRVIIEEQRRVEIEIKKQKELEEKISNHAKEIRKQKTEAKNMAEEVKAPVKKEVSKKEKKPSRQDLILKALCMKSIKTVDDCVKKVIEWNPEDKSKEKDVKNHVTWTVAKLKNKAGRFAKYDFNAETFECAEKQ